MKHFTLDVLIYWFSTNLVFRHQPALAIIKVEEGGNNPATVEGSGVRDYQIFQEQYKAHSLVCEKR
jgi:hypothetical protein